MEGAEEASFLSGHREAAPIWIYRLFNSDWLKNLSLGKLVIWIAVETGEYSNKEISFIYSALLAKICMLPLKNLNFKGQTSTHLLRTFSVLGVSNFVVEEVPLCCIVSSFFQTLSLRRTLL